MASVNLVNFEAEAARCATNAPPRESATSVNLVNFDPQAARFSSACAASAISVAMISAAGSSFVTMPTD